MTKVIRLHTVKTKKLAKIREALLEDVRAVIDNNELNIQNYVIIAWGDGGNSWIIKRYFRKDFPFFAIPELVKQLLIRNLNRDTD